MSGHNKWSQIKRQKGVTDAAKSKIFSKMARNISVEAKKAGGNRNSPGLRAAIEKARAVNMPNDNIDRAINKASDSAPSERIVYEAYGPGGVALIIDTLSDNRNKSTQEVKHALSEHSGNLAEMGAASWAFEKTGEGYAPTMSVDLEDADLEKLEKLVEALEALDDVQEVFTNAS
jgi:YebC/PmpR family DNA-binding regulatory protein